MTSTPDIWKKQPSDQNSKISIHTYQKQEGMKTSWHKMVQWVLLTFAQSWHRLSMKTVNLQICKCCTQVNRCTSKVCWTKCDRIPAAMPNKVFHQHLSMLCLGCHTQPNISSGTVQVGSVSFWKKPEVRQCSRRLQWATSQVQQTRTPCRQSRCTDSSKGWISCSSRTIHSNWNLHHQLCRSSNWPSPWCLTDSFFSQHSKLKSSKNCHSVKKSQLLFTTKISTQRCRQILTWWVFSVERVKPAARNGAKTWESCVLFGENLKNLRRNGTQTGESCVDRQSCCCALIAEKCVTISWVASKVCLDLRFRLSHISFTLGWYAQAVAAFACACA